MYNQNPFDDNYFVVSQDLLIVLGWLIEKEQEGLKKLLQKAVKNGLGDSLNKEPSTSAAENRATPESLQQTIVDFLALLEALMYETNDEHNLNDMMQRTLIPAIKHIDTSTCDATAMEISIAKATNSLRLKGSLKAKEVLCKELLKRWKPLDKKVSN